MQPAPPSTGRLIRLPELKAMVGLSKSAIYQRIAEGSFPTPVALGPRARAWTESSIREWIADRVRESRTGAS